MPATSKIADFALRSVISSAAARVLSFVPAAIATFAASRLVISHFGIAAFDAFSLIVALIALIPLNDLGVGAAVTSAYAGDGPESERGFRVTLTATRVLAISTLVTAAAAAIVAVLGAWPTLIGSASGPNGWTGASIVIFATAFVPGLGADMLLGVHRNHVTVYTQMAQAPVLLLGVAAVWLLGAGAGPLLLVPSVTALVLNIVLAGLASRATGITWSRVLRGVLAGPRRAPGASVRALAGPVLVTSIATPIALQLDRIVLSHVSTPAAVANYSVAVQIFAPALALIAAAATPLWPVWERARTRGEQGPKVPLVVVAFVGGGLLMGAVLAAIANPVADLIGTGHLHLGVLLPIAGALSVVVTALAYPIAMNLMDPSGARFIAAVSVIGLPVNVVLSVVLGRHLGAPGPLFATAVVSVGVQCLPALFYIRRRRSTGRHREGGATNAATAAALSRALAGTADLTPSAEEWFDLEPRRPLPVPRATTRRPRPRPMLPPAPAEPMETGPRAPR